MSSTVITLMHPIDVDGVRYEAVPVRHITFEEWRNINRINASKEVRGLKIVGLATGLPPRVLNEIELADTQQIADFLYSHKG